MMKIKREIKAIQLPLDSKIEGMNVELEFSSIEEFKEYKEQERKDQEVLKELLTNQLPTMLKTLDMMMSDEPKLSNEDMEKLFQPNPEVKPSIKLTPAAPVAVPGIRLAEDSEEVEEIDEEEDDVCHCPICDEFEEEDEEEIEIEEDDEDDECYGCDGCSQPMPIPTSPNVPRGFRLVESAPQAQEDPAPLRIRFTPTSTINTTPTFKEVPNTNSPFVEDNRNVVPGQIMFRELFKDDEIKDDYDK